MTYDIKLHPGVAKYLKSLDSNTKARIKESIETLSDKPYPENPRTDIKKLKGTKGRKSFYRLRVGNYRVIYTIEDETILITDIIHREKGYKWL
ncbi:addiction module toxin, RelE/StbE family [Methanohalobium evestigatum Z-7303]|uniref:Addiction module toxin, RelE/StbE family n=1 Tax=Methanohalobium evestigatum (strain ATCC BAA-1072 / DSM 3721 / NBRC 107634 / OCM 161 / Z-7303) TaxID=644295 RepID=D7E7M1_METEZ|nr:type II toxin-antitoxin system RelE/ParE family toxin [Methanohalobium evestigatum]ADI74094.1 addiction module toxin, RelE/StbE family [Methanohalobium evestigatum Z-7303]